MNLIALDPRQAKALSNYKSPTSPTFGDLKNSMINAGYDIDYSDSVHGRKPAWLTQGIRDDVNLIRRAEFNLRHYASLEIDMDSKNGIELAKIKVNVSQFVLKTLARKKYEEKGDVEAPTVTINVVNYNDEPKIEVHDIEAIDNVSR